MPYPPRVGAELVGERGPGAAPVPLSDLLVENLGQIDTRHDFHSSKSIFPPGGSEFGRLGLPLAGENSWGSPYTRRA